NKKEKDLRIDIIHYFKSLQDICASLLRCDEKKAEDIINQIFEENELKKQHKITDFYSEEHEQQKATLILKDVQQKTTPKGKQQKTTLTSKNKQQKTTSILKYDQQKTTPISKDLKRKNTNEESNKDKKQKKIFDYLQKEVQNNELKRKQFSLEFTCKALWSNYLKVIQNPIYYKFIAYNPRKISFEKDPILYEFKRIDMNLKKKAIKKTDEENKTDKKKDFVRKRLYKDKEG
ncbi:23599_t:CDS:2, partial [Gigaspora rosea]